MDRIYTNHRRGERRIHIEIDEKEIAGLLNEIASRDFEAFDATKDLVNILKTAHAAFSGNRQRHEHGAEISRT